jgi:glycosyltransferase involved in cell wall biosynthesis
MENIKDHLEIVIITYNRASLLQNTLNALFSSPFTMCHITILNNASTDNTLEICNTYLDKFHDLSIITNKINIGGNANILRAIEISNGKYTWVLCDDDEYDFSDCNDFIEAIISEKTELIHVGAHTDVPWNLGGVIDTPRNLVKKGYSFFRFSSFVPCNVFKTSSFYPFIVSGYNNIINGYPHIPFLLSFFELNKNIYITKNRIAKAVIGYQPYSSKDFYMWWLNSSLLLNNKKERIIMFMDQFEKKNIIKNIYLPVKFLLLFFQCKLPIGKYIDLFGNIYFLFSFPLLPFVFIYSEGKKILKKLIK